MMRIVNNIIEYYGNKVGYISGNSAHVDEMFKKQDIEDFLKTNQFSDITWDNGIYDRIIQNKSDSLEILKKCRIYQLKPEVDAEIKFIGYQELRDKGYGTPDMDNYIKVFDGDINTNDLDRIYVLFNSELPESYEGHTLSKSDIIELYDESGSDFFYVDTFGFVRLEGSNQTNEQVSNEETWSQTQNEQSLEPEQEQEPKHELNEGERFEEEGMEDAADNEEEQKNEFLSGTFTFVM